MKKRKIPKPFWNPGEPVILYETKIGDKCSGTKEYGRVIDSFWDPKTQWYDVYVAFYGSRWPSNSKPLKDGPVPYVLRYLETSLVGYRTGKMTFGEP